MLPTGQPSNQSSTPPEPRDLYLLGPTDCPKTSVLRDPPPPPPRGAAAEEACNIARYFSLTAQRP